MKRSAVLLAIAFGVCAIHDAGAKIPKGTQRKPFTPELEPGDYVWKPEISPTGPVVLIVSLPEQKVYVYRNGVRIGRATISTGKPGYRTPTGMFTILQKRVKHTSNIYKGAKMPYMQRLTWDGIAIHAGNLPGYPASGGCVRLPLDFAQHLYAVTDKGTTVIVTDGKSAPHVSSQPGLLLSREQSPPAVGRSGFSWSPEKAPKGPVSILVSSADDEMYVYRNGIEIGRSAVEQHGRFSGSYAYTALSETNSDGSRKWNVLARLDNSRSADVRDFAKRFVIPPDFLKHVRSVIAPGATLIVTDKPVNPRTRSGRDFKILTTENP